MNPPLRLPSRQTSSQVGLKPSRSLITALRSLIQKFHDDSRKLLRDAGHSLRWRHWLPRDMRMCPFHGIAGGKWERAGQHLVKSHTQRIDRKSTRLNSSHANISYAVFCLKKKKQHQQPHPPKHSTTQHPIPQGSL